VPFRQVPRHFTRPIKVVGWDGGTVLAAEKANALAAIQGRLGGLGLSWTSATDYAELTDETDAALREALFGRDVLLVFDQNDDSRRLKAIGTAWHERLRAFLEAGGIVIVLDGRKLDDETPSNTVAILSAPPPTRGAPLLDAEPSPSAVTESDVRRLFATHPLRAGVADTVTARTNTVWFDLGDTEQPSEVYAVPNMLCPAAGCPSGATVIDKIFPVYTLGITPQAAPSGAHCPTGTILVTVAPEAGPGFPENASYTCTLDDGAPASCAPGDRIEYSESAVASRIPSHRLVFATTDTNGNPGRAAATSFPVDVTPPDVRTTGGGCAPRFPCASGYTCDLFGQTCGAGTCCQNYYKALVDDIFFYVTGAEPPGATFTCKIDDGPEGECRSAAGAACTYPYTSCSFRFSTTCGVHRATIVARDECAAMGGELRTTVFDFEVVCIQ
jgi:hypothetical protein